MKKYRILKKGRYSYLYDKKVPFFFVQVERNILGFKYWESITRFLDLTQAEICIKLNIERDQSFVEEIKTEVIKEFSA